MSKLAFLCIIFVTFFVSSCVTDSDATETIAEKSTVPVAELIKQSDEIYKQRENLDKLREAVTLLRKARSSDPQNFEVNWKLAQADYCLGKNSTDEKESEKAFKEGISAAKISTRVAPEKPDGYFWTAANLGGQAKKNTLSGITSVGEIRELMQKVIEIQPNFQGASAYEALAQIELNTRLTGGSAEKALEYLQKAYELEKTNAYIPLRMAEAYLILDRDADAKKHIDMVFKTKPHPDFVPEYNDAVKEAKILLEKKF